MTNILSSPLFSIASSAGANAAAAAQQALINAAAVAAVTARNTIGGINSNNYNQQILHSLPTTPIILDQKQTDNSSPPSVSTTCHIKNEQQLATIMLDGGNSNGGLNASLSISQRNLQVFNKMFLILNVK